MMRCVIISLIVVIATVGLADAMRVTSAEPTPQQPQQEIRSSNGESMIADGQQTHGRIWLYLRLLP